MDSVSNKYCIQKNEKTDMQFNNVPHSENIRTQGKEIGLSRKCATVARVRYIIQKVLKYEIRCRFGAVRYG